MITNKIPKLLSSRRSSVILFLIKKYPLLLNEKYLQNEVISFFNFQPIHLFILKLANVIKKTWHVMLLI